MTNKPVDRCPKCQSGEVHVSRPSWADHDFREVCAEWECVDCGCMWLTIYKYHGTDEHPDWGEDNG